MTQLIYHNGLLFSEDEIHLSLKDRSYLYGEGLFETMKAINGFIPFLNEHLARLYRGIDILGIPFHQSASKLQFAIYQTLFHNQMKDAYIRLNLSTENEDFGSFIPSKESNLFIWVRPYAEWPQRVYSEGIAAQICPNFRVYPDYLCPLKTSNYLRYILALQEAKKKGFGEALFLNTAGFVVEGSTTNLFVYRKGLWKTPGLDQGCMAGTARQVILQLMDRNHLSAQEAPLSLEELQTAEEAFLCNSVREVIPLTRVDEHAISEGKIGPQTENILRLLKDEIQFRFESFESKLWGVQEEG